MTAQEIIVHMQSLYNERQRNESMRYFKTGPGEYGEGDEFLGLTTPQTRQVVKLATPSTPLSQVPMLLNSPWHEVRSCGLLIMVEKFAKQAAKRLENDDKAIAERDKIVRLYLKHADRANNWDLVDLTAPKIIGRWLLLPSRIEDKLGVMDELAASHSLWRQRISMVSTWMTTRQGDPSWALRYATVHLHHPHDLMHKAVGWMLREVGKHGGMDLLRQFLEQHAHEMPRTALRYAIEKMPPEERRHWLAQKTNRLIT